MCSYVCWLVSEQLHFRSSFPQAIMHTSTLLVSVVKSCSSIKSYKCFNRKSEDFITERKKWTTKLVVIIITHAIVAISADAGTMYVVIPFSIICKKNTGHSILQAKYSSPPSAFQGQETGRKQHTWNTACDTHSLVHAAVPLRKERGDEGGKAGKESGKGEEGRGKGNKGHVGKKAR